jgi:hypothetical protein
VILKTAALLWRCKKYIHFCPLQRPCVPVTLFRKYML